MPLRPLRDAKYQSNAERSLCSVFILGFPTSWWVGLRRANNVTASDARTKVMLTPFWLHYAIFLDEVAEFQRSSAAQTSMRTTNSTGAEDKNSSSRSRIIRPFESFFRRKVYFKFRICTPRRVVVLA